MALLLRVELPDVPGALGDLASALGTAGSDISAIQVVEHRDDGTVVDDVLAEPAADVMPDALVTACHRLDGVHVQWISRYATGASLSMDLEALEALAAEPAAVLTRLVDVVPTTFRADWAMAITPDPQRPDVPVVLRAHESAPPLPDQAGEWLEVTEPVQLPDVNGSESTILAAMPGRARGKRPFTLVVARHGGPDFLSSELARLGLLVNLAASLQNDDAST